MNLIEFLKTADDVPLYDAESLKELGLTSFEYTSLRQKEKNISPLCVEFGDADRYMCKSMEEKGLNELDYYEMILTIGLAERLLGELKPRHGLGETGLEWRIQAANHKLRILSEEISRRDRIRS